MKAPIGFIPNWPPLLNRDKPDPDGGIEIIPCGVVLATEPYWQVDDDSVINEARQYLKQWQEPADQE